MCCLIKTHVECTLCEEKWCEACWLKGYYSREYSDVYIRNGLKRVFRCSQTGIQVLIESGEGPLKLVMR